MQAPSDQLKTVRLLQRIALIVLSVMAVIICGFALVSGIETFGSGFSSIIENSPNTLPWLALLGLVWLAWRNKKTGGLLITIFGLVITWFFNFRGQNFFLITFVICLTITFLGFMIWMCESLIRAAGAENEQL
jgi:hypothetical protein